MCISLIAGKLRIWAFMQHKACVASRLKRCRAFNDQCARLHWVLQLQSAGVQAESIMQRHHGGWGVQGIAQYRVADVGHVYTQLV